MSYESRHPCLYLKCFIHYKAIRSHPGTAVRHYLRVGALLRCHLPLLASSPLFSGFPRPARLFVWRLFTASSWWLLPETPRSRSQGSDNTDLSPFFYGFCRRPNLSWCGLLLVISRPLPPPLGHTPFWSLYKVSVRETLSSIVSNILSNISITKYWSERRFECLRSRSYN